MEDCILWVGCTNSTGYGKTRFRGKQMCAHRVAFITQVRELKSGEVLRHTCYNKRCINVNHLVPGTQAQNLIDRSMRSKRNAVNKLWPADVLAIRRELESGGKQTEIARRYGVSQATVYNIKARKIWAHL